MTRRRYQHRPFRISDLAALDLLHGEAQNVQAQLSEFAALARKDGLRHACLVTMYEGKPLFIIGYQELEDGIAQVFVLPDKRIFEHQAAFVRAVIVWRDWLQNTSWCKGILTASLDCKLIDRWMEKLGFVCERKLTSYTDSGQDYKLWSRVKVDGLWQAI